MEYERLDKETIKATLIKGGHPLDRLEILPIIDSTNNYLCNQRDFKGLYAVFAEQQTAGRGRIGHQWISPPGNLYLSLLWHHTGTLHALSELYQLSGQSVLNALQKAGLHDIYLKLPNDIFHNNRKLGGILIELFPSTKFTYDIIIGVGINLCPLPEEQSHMITQPWVTLHTLDPVLATKRNTLAGAVLTSLLHMVHTLTIKQ